MDLARVGLGVAGALDAEIVRDIASRLERDGFGTFWINDTPHGDSLAKLAVAASVTTRIRLATGVIPLDRKSSEEIASDVKRHDLPVDRLVLGVGSGSSPGGLGRVRDGVIWLREQVACPVFVGALGPKMRHLAATSADGLLLNWLTPDGAREAVEDMRRDIGEQGRAPIEMALYVRVALGPDAFPRLEAEAARYEGFPSYAANFRRLNTTALDTTIRAENAGDLRRQLTPYAEALDEVVVRAVTARDTTNDYLRLVEAIAVPDA